jgi:DNA-directed RNA polymerase specialized sigma subunit
MPYHRKKEPWKRSIPDRAREAYKLWFHHAWTQKAIAQKFGVSQGAVYQWIRAVKEEKADRP